MGIPVKLTAGEVEATMWSYEDRGQSGGKLAQLAGQLFESLGEVIASEVVGSKANA